MPDPRFRGPARMLALLLMIPAMVHGAPGMRTDNEGVVSGDYGYSETATDLAVKVASGHVRVQREWSRGRWHFFPSWGGLEPRVGERAVAGGFDGLVAGQRPDAIVRGRYTYEREDDSAPARWAFDERRWIVATDTGYRWENRAGEWIKYDEQGRMLAYGGRNDVEVRVERDDRDRITRVLDHHGDMALAFTYDGEGRPVRARGRAGREVHYEWSGERLVAVTDVRGARWQYAYKSIVNQTRLTQKTDPDGRTTELRYAIIGGATACVPSGAGSWTIDNSGAIAWNGGCRQKSVPRRAYLKAKADARGVIERYRYAYDGDADRFVRATVKGGVLTERVLDDRGRLIERRVAGETVERWRHGETDRVHIDARGRETRTEVNRYDERVRVTHPDGATEQWRYGEYGNVIRYVDELGTVTEHEYDDSGNRIRTVEAKGEPAERVIEYRYDGYGHLTLHRLVGDARTPTAENTWTYDRHGNAETMTDAAGHTRHYTGYNARGDVLGWTDRAGHEWRRTLDAAGNPLSLTDPLGHQRRWTYDGAGNRIEASDALDQRTTYAYDAAGLLTAITDPTGATTTFAYDDRREIVEVTDADGVTGSLDHDDAGRPAKVVDPAGVARELTWGDPAAGARADQLARVEGPRRTTEYRYDDRGRRTAVIVTGDDGTRRITRYGYDDAGRLDAVTDPGGRTTQYTHDALGRITRTTDPSGHTIELVHDDRGNVTRLTNRRDVVLRRFRYDARGLRRRAEWPDGTAVTYRYGPRGEPVRTTDAKGQIEATAYDAAGRREAVRYYADGAALDAGTPERTTTFTYNATGRLTGYDDGTTTATRSHDALGRLTRVEVDFGPFSKSFRRTWTDAGRPASLTRSDGGTIAYRHDGAGRLAAITRPDGTGLGFGYDAATGQRNRLGLPGGSERHWQHDGLGRIERIRAVDPADNALMDRRYHYADSGNITRIDTRAGATEYAYDQLDRLTGATHPELEAEAFTYDPAGNRTTSAATEGTWTYDDANRLQGYDDTTFTHDANGATTQKTGPEGTTTYGYDIRRRLERIDTPDGTTQTNAYDPMERRISKTVDGETTYYLYGREGLLAEFDADGNAKRRYGWAPQGMWSTDPLWMTEGGEDSYYLTDHLGTPQKMIGRNGEVRWSARYKAFGEAEVTTEAVTNPWRFPGQYHDQETGRHYNYFRAYDPGIGRYVSSDPIGLRGGLNTFAYAGGDPIDYIDPLGLFDVYATKLSKGKYVYKFDFSPGRITGMINQYQPFSPSKKLNRLKKLCDAVTDCDLTGPAGLSDVEGVSNKWNCLGYEDDLREAFEELGHEGGRFSGTQLSERQARRAIEQMDEVLPSDISEIYGMDSVVDRARKRAVEVFGVR